MWADSGPDPGGKLLVLLGFLRGFSTDAEVALMARFELARIRAVAKDYRELGEVSGLAQKIPKLVVLPLQRTPLDDAARRICVAGVGWDGLEIARNSEYLGFWLGPSSGEASWEGPMAKFRAKATSWSRTGMLWGCRYSCRVASHFVDRFAVLPWFF